MKHYKLLSIICSVVFGFSSCATMTAFASDTTTEISVLDESDNTDAAGLIMSYSLAITGTSRNVFITANTTGYETMAKIGFEDIVIQHSSNGISGWTDEVPLNDDIAENTFVHSKNQERHSVSGGYYYRVKLSHYAKETGWFFPSSQSITNYSNVIWVS